MYASSKGAAGIPDEVKFATKGELAQQMLTRAFAAGVAANWVVGLVAALLPAEAWVVLSAGEGSKGPRLYEWAWLQLPEETEAASGRVRWVLIRRSLADGSQRAYYRASAPAQTTLRELVRVTGSRWQIEEGYEQSKGGVGLDQYEVRTWRAWHRYVTLALLAYAVLVVMQQQARAQEKKWCSRPADRTERAGGPSFTAGGGSGAGTASPTTALVAFSTPAPVASSALPSAAPSSPGTWRVGEPTGSSWRELPERFGPWSTVASRFQRWLIVVLLSWF